MQKTYSYFKDPILGVGEVSVIEVRGHLDAMDIITGWSDHKHGDDAEHQMEIPSTLRLKQDGSRV